MTHIEMAVFSPRKIEKDPSLEKEDHPSEAYYEKIISILNKVLEVIVAFAQSLKEGIFPSSSGSTPQIFSEAPSDDDDDYDEDAYEFTVDEIEQRMTAMIQARILKQE